MGLSIFKSLNNTQYQTLLHYETVFRKSLLIFGCRITVVLWYFSKVPIYKLKFILH